MSSQCMVEHLKEFRHLEECDHSRKHEAMEPCDHGQESCQEVQTEEDFMKLRKFKPGEAVRLDLNMWAGPTDELRQARVFRLRGDMDTVAVGLPSNERWTGGVKANKAKDVMPTQNGRGVRSCARKIEVASMFQTARPKRVTCNEAELRKALASIGE